MGLAVSGTTDMTRRGRKRKAGKRYRSGDLLRKTESPAARAAEMPHRRGLEHPDDQRGESELGRLCLRGQIEPIEYEAGRRYFRLWKEYLAVIMAPRSSSVTAGAFYDCGGCLGTVGTIHCTCALRARFYFEAHNVLLQPGRSIARKLIDLVVINDCPWSGSLKPLQIGLQALADHFGLTFRNKSDLVNASSHSHGPKQHSARGT